MSLKEYRHKRRFDATPEPAGKKTAAAKGPLHFVVQKHQASQLHYDFRLELNGALVSWAVPKGPSLDPSDHRLAMKVEDHPLQYRHFEGIIPAGNYGAGTVMVWDQGNYAAYGAKTRGDSTRAIKAGLKKGHITFILNGDKLKGEFALIKLKDSQDENAWLLVKAKKDEYARAGDVTKKDRSVKSGQSMQQIAGQSAAAGKVWKAKADLNLTGLPKAKMPHHVKPMLATLVEVPFDNPDWQFEIKWDGYRATAEVTKEKVALYSRNLQPFEAKFAPIAETLMGLGAEAVLDGEIVVLDKQGRSRFQLLQNYQKTGEGNLVYYVFDLLWVDGHDLRDQPLARRQKLLAELIKGLPNVKFSDAVIQKGTDFFQLAVKQGLEGIVAKDTGSSYLAGKRTRYWQKIKTHLRQESIVVGYTDPKGSRRHFGSLVLGLFDQGQLKYAGHSGGGFSESDLKSIKQQLKPLETQTSPLANPPSDKNIHWVKPQLVCEMAFTEWTEEGQMRHPVFIGWREDKPAAQVVREGTPSGLPSSKGGQNDQTVSIGGRQLTLTNLNKIYWPHDGYSKGQLIDYYRRIAPVMLPYLADRPENLNRHPGGINGPSFYQKDTTHSPDWATTAKIYSQSNRKDINYLVCNDEATLVYMANLGCIEINPWNSRLKTLDRPDWLVMDIDPPKTGKVDFDQVVEVAQTAKKILEAAGAESYCKTSGGTGLHVYVPLGAKYSYDQAKEFTHILALLINARLPKTTTVERTPAKRRGRIYLDYLQNRKGQTLAAPYSVRPKPGATVSTPLKWEEVRPGISPLNFTFRNIFKRLEKYGDLWQPVVGRGVDLKKALAELSPEIS